MEEDNQKDAVEQLVDNAAEKAKDTALKATKKAAKFAVRKIAAAIGQALISLITTILPYIAIIMAVVLIVGGFGYLIEMLTGEDTTDSVYSQLGIKEFKGDIANIVEIKHDSSGYHLEFIDGFEDNLKQAIHDINKQNMSINIKNLDSLKKFIKAEAITKFPYLGGENDGNTKFQGSIYLKRITPDKNIGEVKEDANSKEIDLTYVDMASFNSLVESNNMQALQVFTLDDNKNIITATWKYLNDGGVEIQKGPVLNYKDATSQYTMPFEYPLFFLIDGECEEFSVELAELAMNSKIEISIIDTVENTKTTTVVTTQTTENTEIFEVKDDGTEKKVESAVIPEKVLAPVEDTTTDLSETVSQSIEINYIDSWAIKKNSESIQYTGNHSDTEEIKGDPSPAVEGEADIQKQGQTKIVTTPTIVTTTDVSKESSKNSYTYGNAKIEDNSAKFVVLYKKYEDTLENNLLPEWLFELMENNDKTSNLVKITKYLLYKATERNYGVTDFEDLDLEDILEFNNFKEVSSRKCK